MPYDSSLEMHEEDKDDEKDEDKLLDETSAYEVHQYFSAVEGSTFFS